MTGKISSRFGTARRGRARHGPRRTRPLAGADLPQLALALQLLEQTVDDVADLAGMP